MGKEEKIDYNGGFLVCLNASSVTNLEFGIDYEIFRTGKEFQGVKFIPFGLHFVFYTTQDQSANKRGFFIHIRQPQQIVVRQWDPQTEDFGPPLGPNARPQVQQNLFTAVRTFQLDAQLAAYPTKTAEKYHTFYTFITTAVLKRVGLDVECLIVPGDPDMILSSEREADIVPFFPNVARTARFTSLKRKPKNLTPADLTQYHFDKSKLLEEILNEAFDGSWKEFLGEMQLSFVLFMFLSSLDALEQWKQFIWLICSCDAAARQYPELFSTFIRILHVHLGQVDADFFDDPLSGENFLRPCLSSLFEVLDDSELDEKLLRNVIQFKLFLKRKFNLNLEMLGTYDFAAEENSPILVTPDELPSSIFSGDLNDSDDVNKLIAQQTFEELSLN